MINNHYSSITRKPSQLKKISAKLGDSQEAEGWRRNTLDYFLARNSIKNNKSGYLEYLYKAAAGHLRESDYTYITNPNHTNKQRSYPAKLRNYDIISPIIQMLMGEYSKRIFKPSVSAVNPDITTIYEQMIAQNIHSEIEQMYINAMNNYADTGFISRDVKDHEAIVAQVDGLKDEKSITGQDALDYIVSNEKIERKLREGFYDFIVTGFTFSEKGTAFKDVFYRTHSPVNCGYLCDENTTFVEDGESAWIKTRMTLSSVVDNFHHLLTKKEIEELEALNEYNNPNNITYEDANMRQMFENLRSRYTTNYNNQLYARDSEFEVAYCAWKSMTLLYKVEGVDVMGQPYEFETGEGYKKLPNEKITKQWVSEAWHGWRIANKYYVGIEPVEGQRGKFDNPSACKLPINGRTLFGRHYYTKSPVEKLLPFQEMHNVIKWQLEKTINKNKDKFLTLPKQLIPDDEDMDMFDMMYHTDADGLMFLDEIDNSQMAALQAIKVVDISARDYIRFLYEVAALIKEEAEEVLGINRQRKGQTFAHDGKSVNEQAIFQSAIVSEELYLEFEEYQDSELSGLLDHSKHAWDESKKQAFIDSDKRQRILSVTKEHRETEYSVTVGNGRKQGESLQILKQQAQAVIQNEGKLSTVAKLVRETNVDKLIDILELEEEKAMNQAQQAQEAEMGAAQQAQELDMKKHDDKIAVDTYKVDAQIYTAELSAGMSDKTPELSLKQQDLDIKREKLQIDREKNQVALQNKVVGEK